MTMGPMVRPVNVRALWLRLDMVKHPPQTPPPIPDFQTEEVESLVFCKRNQWPEPLILLFNIIPVTYFESISD